MIYCVNPELVCNNEQPQIFSKPILAYAYYNGVNFYVNYCPYSTSLPIATCGYSNEALHYAELADYFLFLIEDGSLCYINLKDREEKIKKVSNISNFEIMLSNTTQC